MSFAVFPNRVSALKFHHDLNTIHKDVKFTYELEHNKQLAFLDVGLDNSTGSIELSVHRKPTHTGLFNKWESMAPLKYEINLIRNLLHRAYRISSNSRLLENEIQVITNLLKKNGYPSWIIRNTTQKFLSKQRDIKNLNKSDQSTKRSNKQILVFLKLQYLHRISTQIEKEIRDFLKHYEIRLVMSHSTFSIGKLFPYKDRRSLLLSVGVVYQLTCSSCQKYSGQTKRNLISRLNEHRTRQSSEVCRHLMENPKHTVNFDSPLILDRSNYSTKLCIKETLHIAKRQTQLNVDSQSLSLFLFNA